MRTEEDIRTRYVEIKPYLNERTRRLFVANEARAYGVRRHGCRARHGDGAQHDRSRLQRGENRRGSSRSVPEKRGAFDGGGGLVDLPGRQSG